MQIDRLETRKRELAESVTLRESIFKSRSTLAASGGYAGLAGTAKMDRMKVVAAKTRLQQYARQQAEELAALRREADRLRKRSYPAFDT